MELQNTQIDGMKTAMAFDKGMFGSDMLKKLMQEPFDIVRFSKWCGQIYSNNIRDFDDDLREILFDLSTMDDDQQFERTKEELVALAEMLICKELATLDIQKTVILDERWLSCLNCHDAWEENNTETLTVICPNCETIYINPRHQEKT